MPAQGTIGDLSNFGFKGAVPSGYKPDSAWNYEVGIKSNLLDKRLEFDLSGYYIDWSDIQQTINLPISGFTLQTNAGFAHVYGFEADFRAAITPELSADLAVGYTHARLPDGLEVNGILLPWTITDAHLTGVPDWTASGNLEYHRIITGGVRAWARTSIRYVGSSYGTLLADSPDYHRPSFTTGDASIGADIGRWQLSLFVKNIGNDTKIIQRPQSYINPQGIRLRPRTIGANVGVNF